LPAAAELSVVLLLPGEEPKRGEPVLVKRFWLVSFGFD